MSSRCGPRALNGRDAPSISHPQNPSFNLSHGAIGRIEFGREAAVPVGRPSHRASRLSGYPAVECHRQRPCGAEALSAWGPAIEPHHIGLCSRFINEDKMFWVQLRLAGAPFFAGFGDISAVLFGGAQ
jgi:hypothetical protein